MRISDWSSDVCSSDLELAAFNAAEARPLTIKLGLHEGPCIAVTLNGRLDYFGTTVNMAARLQGQSDGGDIVLSEAVAEDAGVAGLLQGLDCARETTVLKGFDAPVAFRDRKSTRLNSSH